MSFLSYNNLEEVNEQKYKEIDQIRLEYQNVVQLLKNSHFPIEIIKGLSMALDDLGDKPLIVRSSSLLEDRMGTAFSGKYKSLFLANQGSKQERLEALTDAIAEVYASIFGPDPIEYRAERGLLDFHEEMGIMIQEVVGQRVGDYFFPAFAGVAFSNNEFRWSSRIKREDGLARHRSRPGHARRRPRQRRLPGPDLARHPQPARQRHRRGDDALLAQAHRRHQSQDLHLRDQGDPRPAGRVRTRIPGDRAASFRSTRTTTSTRRRPSTSISTSRTCSSPSRG